MGTERPVVAAAPAAPALEAAPASAVGATGCVMSWPRIPAGAWKSHAGLMGCCRGQGDARRVSKGLGKRKERMKSREITERAEEQRQVRRTRQEGRHNKKLM